MAVGVVVWWCGCGAAVVCGVGVVLVVVVVKVDVMCLVEGMCLVDVRKYWREMKFIEVEEK